MTDTPLRTTALAAIAPITWGSTYIVTTELLPPDRPLFTAAVRALPAGLVLLAFRPRLPTGSWWWRSAVLGLVNIGLFFPLIFLSAYHLPGGLASTIQATAPLAVIALAWWLLRERPGVARIVGALVGALGVALLVMRAGAQADPIGLSAAFGSIAISAVGFVLVKKWEPPVDMITLTAWQLVGGGLFIVPAAAAFEGPPPALDLPAVAGLAWITVVGTAVAYSTLFTALKRMPAGSTALIGLLNPVTGTTLGVVVAGEFFGPFQALGTALVLGGVLAGQPIVTEKLRRWRTREDDQATAEKTAVA